MDLHNSVKFELVDRSVWFKTDFGGRDLDVNYKFFIIRGPNLK